MSFLRPARKVTAPDGRAWEIYVSRFSPPSGSPLRLLLTFPRTLARGLRSEELRVEAVSFHPWPESHLWLTSRDHLGRVVEQVAAGLEAGQVAQPVGARFRGTQEMLAGTFRGLGRDG